MRVSLEPPDQADVVALVAELDAYQDALYPPEVRYATDLTALSQDNVLLAVARLSDGTAVGCGAVMLTSGHGELKRVFVRPGARSLGVAQQIIQLLESAAQARNCEQILLETGPLQVEALAFYAKHGHERCGPFGEYPEHPLSVFMVKRVGIECRLAKPGDFEAL